MDLNEKDIIRYIDPVFRFCLRRLNDRMEAEDLSSDIMVHIIDGMKRYRIDSLDPWVWRIAHNRYARFVESRNKQGRAIISLMLHDVHDGDDFVDSIVVRERYDEVFRYLHSLSAEYRDLAVGHYIDGLSVKRLSEKFSLPESTVKWRLNESRKKIKNGIGERKMDKVYKRLDWNTHCCNGSMDPNEYLHSQLARSICEAAYEKPLTVGEISLKTGIPALYIEDELPRLIYGDAVEQAGKKYAANFIIYRLKDQKRVGAACAKLIGILADHYQEQFIKHAPAVEKMDFYGSDFTMRRLGYIALPASIRYRIWDIKNKMPGFEDGPYPPRKDGGYGWFIVRETEDSSEGMPPFSSGCNITGYGEGSEDCIYYYWIGKYFYDKLYNNRGTRWLDDKKIVQSTADGVIEEGRITEDDMAALLKNNLVIRSGDSCKLNFACFSSEAYDKFFELFNNDNEKIDKLLADLIKGLKNEFVSFVPKRLGSQINQYISGCMTCIGEIAEELMNRGVLERPGGKNLTNGVFYISGKYRNV